MSVCTDENSADGVTNEADEMDFASCSAFLTHSRFLLGLSLLFLGIPGGCSESDFTDSRYRLIKSHTRIDILFTPSGLNHQNLSIKPIFHLLLFSCFRILSDALSIPGSAFSRTPRNDTLAGISTEFNFADA